MYGKKLLVEQHLEAVNGNKGVRVNELDKMIPDCFSIDLDGNKFFVPNPSSLMITRSTYRTNNENEARRFIELLKEDRSAFVVGNTYIKTCIVVNKNVEEHYEITILSNGVGIRLANKLMGESSIKRIAIGQQKPNDKVVKYLGMSY